MNGVICRLLCMIRSFSVNPGYPTKGCTLRSGLSITGIKTSDTYCLIQSKFTHSKHQSLLIKSLDTTVNFLVICLTVKVFNIPHYLCGKRQAIFSIFLRVRSTDPSTGRPLHDRRLVPNPCLRGLIAAIVEHFQPATSAPAC